MSDWINKYLYTYAYYLLFFFLLLEKYPFLTKARTDMTFFVNVIRKEKNMDCLIDPIPLIF